MVTIRTLKGNTMKLKYMFLAAASVLALGSCVRDAISPLTGKYPAPEVYEMTKVLSQPSEKVGNTRMFTVELATEGVTGSEGNWQGTGSVLCVKFIGDKYFLHDAAYTAAPAGTAKKGNYIVGQDGSAMYTVTDGQAKSIGLDYGSITVLSDNGDYTISGTVWLADESIVQVKANVVLTYEADPEPVMLTKVLQAQSNLSNGTNTVTMQLATDGVNMAYDPATWQNVYSGTGNYLAIDIYSEDGYLHPGTYKPSATGGTVNAGEYGIGWDPGDLWGIGMVFTNWGTCWWTANDGATSAEKILEGEILVEKNGSTYTITYNHNGIFFRYNGKIEAVDPDGGQAVAYTELKTLISASVNQGLVTLNLATDGVSAEYDPATYSWVYSGTGNYLATDIYSADGKLHEGTYQACSEGGKVGEGQFGIGYDTEMWGMQFFNWGTCWWTVTDGATSAEKILDGTLTVTSDGDNYTITIESSVINARYTGPVTFAQ